jgi:hypothetical protein
MEDTASLNYFFQMLAHIKNIKTQIMKDTIKHNWNITIRYVMDSTGNLRNININR